ncbi:hypothetical protein J4Q44_G00055390 [Coregonus suidteri]|uniref:Uncharacterized protein n=1 Tax=Coregonus suidteri TaxID=861788 RepID=A0AAN8MFT7_9TELE
MFSSPRTPPLSSLARALGAARFPAIARSARNGVVHLGPVFGIRKHCCFLTGEKEDRTPLDFLRNCIWTPCYRGF